MSVKKIINLIIFSVVLIGTIQFSSCKNASSSGGSSSSTENEMLSTPLTFEALSNGSIQFNNLSKITGLKYSINNQASVAVNSSAEIQFYEGDTISLFANGIKNKTDSYVPNDNECFSINCTSDCYIYGNIQSLVFARFENYRVLPYGTDYTFRALFKNNTHIKNHPSKKLLLPALKTHEGCYHSMFYGCTSLTSAPELPASEFCADSCYNSMFKGCTSLISAPKLPSTNLASTCYASMFDGCTSLTSAPVLPATILAGYCYSSMFKNCTSLVSTPKLPATTLGKKCYASMFEGCTSLTTAPILSSTALQEGCYESMFQGCTSLTSAPELSTRVLVRDCYKNMFTGCINLTYIKCLATNIEALYCTNNWLKDTKQTGTFVKSKNMNSWTTDTSGIPSGWTVQEAQ